MDVLGPLDELVDDRRRRRRLAKVVEEDRDGLQPVAVAVDHGVIESRPHCRRLGTLRVRHRRPSLVIRIACPRMITRHETLASRHWLARARRPRPLRCSPGPLPPTSVDGVPIDPDAELVVALTDDTNNMDPRIGMGSIRSNYIRQVFESLVDVDRQGKPVPGLALSWKPVNDLTWEFALRRGVTFHDGEPFNADTVLFNLDRMFRKNLDRWGIKDVPAGTSFEKVYPFVTRWEKVDDFTVRVHTSEPAPTLWDFLGREPLVPRAWTIKNGVEALNDKPVGTGPWKLVGLEAQGPHALRAQRRLLGHAPADQAPALAGDPRGGGPDRRAAGRPGHLVEAVPPLDAGVLAQEPAPCASPPAVQKLACRLYLNGRTKDTYESGGRDGAFADPRTRLALNLAVNREAIITEDLLRPALANASPVATVAYGYARPAGLPVRSRRGPRPCWPRRAGQDGPAAGHAAAAAQPSTTARPSTRRSAAVVEMLKDVGVQVTMQVARLRHAAADADQGHAAAQRRLRRLPHQQQPRRRRLRARLGDHHAGQLDAVPAGAAGPVPVDAPPGRPQEAAGRAGRAAATGAGVGAGGVALPGEEGLRPRRARAPVRPRPRS